MGTDIFDKYKALGEWAIVKPMGSDEQYIGCITSPKGLPDDKDAAIALLFGGIEICPALDYAVQIEQDRQGNMRRNEMAMPHNLSPEIETPMFIKPSVITLYRNLSDNDKRNFEKLVRHAEMVALQIRGATSGVQLVGQMPPELNNQQVPGKPSILKI